MSTTEMNRIETATEMVEARLAGVPESEREKLDAGMAIDFEEHFAYQETQAWAHASGLISADEALVIYTALGEVGSAENGGWAKDTPLVTKVIVSLVTLELIVARRNARRS